MRSSRLAVATIALTGIVVIASNPGCGSTGEGGFGDAGDYTESGLRIVHNPDGSITILNDAKSGSDSPHMLSNGQDSSAEATISHEAGFSDAKVKVDGTTCVPDAQTSAPGMLKHTCIIWNNGGSGDDNNECDGHHDPPSPYPANGSTGNGFDDNCNGLVDEGCSCPTAGATKPCYLVPATQTENGLPVGWCATNSVGTVNCESTGESGAQWSGTCRGAQPPYANDVCAPGDFNCDGTPENPVGVSCACAGSAIVCPTAPVVTVPYPPPTALPLKIDASTWFTDPAQASSATNWVWSMTGGDCDNILPYPTFGMYPTADGSGNPVSVVATNLGMNMKEHGEVWSGAATTDVVYPAFSLSGSYVLTGSWVLDGKDYSCTVQIEAKAPGVRAEGCWSSEGTGDDLDLHMAKVNGFNTAQTCQNMQGWSDNVCSCENEDCYYGDCYGSSLFGGDVVDWGYNPSVASACTGWGSQTTGTSCGNPRLDRDANGLSGICDKTVSNPNGSSGTYCGPENINVDVPKPGDEFAVGLRFYARHGSSMSVNALTHVNIYCDGLRIYSGGYDPTTTGANYPQLAVGGDDTTGDMWKVGLVTIGAGDAGGISCTVAPTNSTTGYAATDGTTTPAYCVDDYTRNGANSQIYLTNSMGVPGNSDALCYH